MPETAKAKLIRTIFWFALPLIISFCTWVVITISGVNANIAAYKANESNTKANQEQIIQTQQEVLVVARESRTFSMENNIILNEKADKVDVKELDERLRIIEFQVNKIYLNHKDWGTTYTSKDSLLYFTKETKKKIDTLIEITFPYNDRAYVWTQTKH